MLRSIETLSRLDWKLLWAAIGLSAIGFIALYGIGISQNPPSFFLLYKQLGAVAIGIGLVVCGVLFDYRQARSLSVLTYLAGAGLLLLVLALGVSVNATRGWFRVGILSFQPVEIAKITLTIYLASFFAKHGRGALTWKTFCLSGIATLFYGLLTLAQPDFGSAMVFFGIWGIMCLFLGLPKHAWVILPTLALLLGGFAWGYALKPYQRDRVFTFLHPERDIRGSGYNAMQARIAIGSGGWFGKGIAEGSQARLRFLPEAATDFLFSVLGEELGFIGIALVLSLVSFIFYRTLRIAAESEHDFGGLILVGLSGGLFIHVFVNAGMNLGIMPITGIPFPFISAAASSMVASFTTIAFAESAAVRRRSIFPVQEEDLMNS